MQTAGDADAVAGCPVVLEGFDHDIDPETGWIMTINLETKDNGG